MSERLRTPSPEASSLDSSPDKKLIEQAREIALNILASPEDNLSREIAEKILAKAEIKQRVDSLLAYADDPTVYQEYKKLGIFVVRDARAVFSFTDPETGFAIEAGDPYLDLHLPPVPQGQRTRKAVKNSLTLVSDYIARQNLQPRYVMGITYPRLANVAQRFGFDVAHPNVQYLPGSVVRGVENVFQDFTQTGLRGEAMGTPAIVFQETEAFVETHPACIPRNQALNHLGAAGLLAVGLGMMNQDSKGF